MPTISKLLSLSGTHQDSPRIFPRPVTSYNLDLRMLLQPRRQRFCRSVWKKVKHMSMFQVDNNRSIQASALLVLVIHSNDFGFCLAWLPYPPMYAQ